MKPKIVTIEGKQYVETTDGKPVYIHDDGHEIPFDAPAALATITARNGEAKTHREAKEAAEAKLKTFEGITDAAAARKALETVANLDAKKLVDAGEVEKIKTEAIKAVEEKYAPVIAERDKYRDDLFSEKVGGSFARSKFIAEKIAIPVDLLQSKFGNHFKVEEGKVVGYDAQGNKLFSRSNPGAVAEFDEAMEMIVGSYAHKDAILKGTGGSGSGARPGGDGKPIGGKNKVYTRDEFNALSPDMQMKAMTVDMATVSD